MLNLLRCSSSCPFLLRGFVLGHHLFLQLFILFSSRFFCFFHHHSFASSPQILGWSNLQICWVILIATAERDTRQMKPKRPNSVCARCMSTVHSTTRGGDLWGTVVRPVQEHYSFAVSPSEVLYWPGQLLTAEDSPFHRHTAENIWNVWFALSWSQPPHLWKHNSGRRV